MHFRHLGVKWIYCGIDNIITRVHTTCGRMIIRYFGLLIGIFDDLETECFHGFYLKEFIVFSSLWRSEPMVGALVTTLSQGLFLHWVEG